MMNLSLTQDGNTAVSALVGFNTNLKLALAAATFREIAAEYRKSPTPYRTALVKKAANEPYLGFSIEDCLSAIDRELSNSTLGYVVGQEEKVLKKVVKSAAWRLANIAESRVIFEMFKKHPSEALKHIRTRFADEYRRIAAIVLERNGYDLTAHDYACTIWLHLSAGNTWKAFDTYRGDSTVYAWLKQVCRHCITDYVESCGYYSLIASNAKEVDNTDNVDLAEMGARSKSQKRRNVRFDDYEVMNIADSRSNYDSDFVVDAPSFLRDRIDEMPWTTWEKSFIIDSVINEMSAVELTEKYGMQVALLQGKKTPFDRSWTDNRNSRMKRDLSAYVLAYIRNDKKVLGEFAKKHRIFDRQQAKLTALQTA